MELLTKASFSPQANQRELDNLKIAYEASCESIVLLKNDGALPLSGKNVAASLDGITLLGEMGISICIDSFETSDEYMEILQVIRPHYVKISIDVPEMDRDSTLVERNRYFGDMIAACEKNGVKVCICDIETVIEDLMMREHNFCYMQGYYYGKPERLEL